MCTLNFAVITEKVCNLFSNIFHRRNGENLNLFWTYFSPSERRKIKTKISDAICPNFALFCRRNDENWCFYWLFVVLTTVSQSKLLFLISFYFRRLFVVLTTIRRSIRINFFLLVVATTKINIIINGYWPKFGNGEMAIVVPLYLGTIIPQWIYHW